MKKAAAPQYAFNFQQIPNIEPRIADDFQKLGLQRPADLKGRDPYKLYQKLCSVTRTYHDPCVLDTFMAAVSFMNGQGAKPWWHFTAERKKRFRLRPPQK